MGNRISERFKFSFERPIKCLIGEPLHFRARLVLFELAAAAATRRAAACLSVCFKLRAMFAHLRKNAIYTIRIENKHKDLAEIIICMKRSPPLRKNKKTTKVTQTQSGDERTTKLLGEEVGSALWRA